MDENILLVFHYNGKETIEYFGGCSLPPYGVTFSKKNLCATLDSRGSKGTELQFHPFFKDSRINLIENFQIDLKK